MSIKTKKTTPVKPRIQVISRASHILRALENEPEGLSLGKIAIKTGLVRSTVQRIVDALLQEGFLIASSTGTGVRLGPALLRLAAAAQADQVQIIRPFISALSVKINETVDISILSGSYAVFVDQVVGKQALRAVSSIGLAMPLWNTAHGKAMLATMDDETVKRHFDVLKRDAPPGQAPSFRKLTEELKKVARENIAYSHEEYSEGVTALGAVVGNLSSNLTAISIPVPTQRYSGQKKWLADSLRDTVKDIRSACGID